MNANWQLLFIEDDADDYDIFITALKDMHSSCSVNWLSNCFNIADNLQQKQYDIIFLDMRLPKIDGLDCLAIIRSVPGYEIKPVIFYSNYHDPSLESKVLADDKNVYWLRKGYTFAELEDELSHLFDKLSKENVPGAA